jgi:integrase
MGVFRKNKDKNGKPTGPWYVQYPASRDAKGKIKYKTLKASWQKKKAQEMLRKKQDEFYQAERLGITATKEMSFSELMDWGLSQEIMKAKATASDDVARAKHLTACFGDVSATKITPLMVDNFRVKMKNTVSEKTNKPFAGTTINRVIALARRVYYLGMDAGIVEKNPFARRGNFKEHPKGKYIPNSDFKLILAKLSKHAKPLAITAYLTGMRLGEILDLSWDSVNLEAGIVELSADETKTGEPRLVFLGVLPELQKVFIEAALRKQRKQDLVFTKPNGSPIKNWEVGGYFKKACQEAGVEPYRFHDLRHTFNTNMIKAGVQKSVVMKLTGHKTLSMFLRYSHLDREQSVSALESLGKMLAGRVDAETAKNVT